MNANPCSTWYTMVRTTASGNNFSLCKQLYQRVPKQEGSKVSPVPHQLVEVFLHVLEHEVERVVFPDHLLQLDHVCVA
jgi:hypothetical protein